MISIGQSGFQWLVSIKNIDFPLLVFYSKKNQGLTSRLLQLSVTNATISRLFVAIQFDRIVK